MEEIGKDRMLKLDVQLECNTNISLLSHSVTKALRYLSAIKIIPEILGISAKLMNQGAPVA